MTNDNTPAKPMRERLATRRKLRTWAARQSAQSRDTATTIRHMLREIERGFGRPPLYAALRENLERLTANPTGDRGHAAR